MSVGFSIRSTENSSVAAEIHAHVEQDGIQMGDTVEISETRPISKTKAWAVTKLVSKAVVV